MPGAGFTVRQVGMDFRYSSLSSNYLPDAYERLLMDAMLGDSTLYARQDALEASWGFIDPILQAWAKKPDKNLYTYPVLTGRARRALRFAVPRSWSLRAGNTYGPLQVREITN